MEVLGLDECLKGVQAELDAMRRKADTAVRLGGQAYVNDVKVRAPVGTDPKTGPHGGYRRSIHVELGHEDNGSPFALCGSNLPFARRLEKGFWMMRDSLGRLYHQYPRPHFMPPLDTEMPKYLAIMAGTFTEEEFGDYAAQTRADFSMYNRMAAGIRPDLASGVMK